VALAGAALYSVDAHNPHLSAMVINLAFLLKPAGDTRDARSLHAHHLSQELLRKRQIFSREVAHPDQPRARAFFNAVKRVARRRLLYLTQGELLVLDDQSAKIRRRVCEVFNNGSIHDTRPARHLDQHLVERKPVINRLNGAKDAIVANHAGLDRKAAFELDNARKYAP
jgi:hypothetical protein